MMGTPNGALQDALNKAFNYPENIDELLQNPKDSVAILLQTEAFMRSPDLYYAIKGIVANMGTSYLADSLTRKLEKLQKSAVVSELVWSETARVSERKVVSPEDMRKGKVLKADWNGLTEPRSKEPNTWSSLMYLDPTEKTWKTSRFAKLFRISCEKFPEALGRIFLLESEVPEDVRLSNLFWQPGEPTPGIDCLEKILPGRFFLPGKVALAESLDARIKWVDAPPGLIEGLIIESSIDIYDAEFIAIAENLDRCEERLESIKDMDDLKLDDYDCRSDFEDSVDEVLRGLKDRVLPQDPSYFWGRTNEILKAKLPEGFKTKLMSLSRDPSDPCYWFLTLEIQSPDGKTWTEIQRWTVE